VKELQPVYVELGPNLIGQLGPGQYVGAWSTTVDAEDLMQAFGARVEILTTFNKDVNQTALSAEFKPPLAEDDLPVLRRL